MRDQPLVGIYGRAAAGVEPDGLHRDGENHDAERGAREEVRGARPQNQTGPDAGYRIPSASNGGSRSNADVPAQT